VTSYGLKQVFPLSLAGEGYVGGGPRRSAYSRDARLTERFTRIDADTLRYEATVDDPRTWTRSWTVAFPLKRDPSYELFEYACHEENYSMPHMLRGAVVGEGENGR